MPKVEISNELTVSYHDSQIVRDAIFHAVMQFYIKHQVFSGETLTQADIPMGEAPYVLAHIADEILQFNETYKDS